MGTSYIASEPVNFFDRCRENNNFIAHTQEARKPSQENSDTNEELIFCLQRLEYLQELEFSNESR